MKPAEQSILFADARQKTEEFKENLKEGWSTLLLLLLRECADECRRSTQDAGGWLSWRWGRLSRRGICDNEEK